MKNLLRFLSALLVIAFCATAYSQDEVVVTIGYMKVKSGDFSKYLEVEKAWKKIHENRMDKGHILGWQLWQKMYGGANDEYQFIVVAWYKNFAKTADRVGFSEAVSEVYTEEEWKELAKKTTDARVYARTDVMHRVATVENSKPTKYLVVAQMKPTPGKTGEYIKMEREIFKPVMEEAIERGEKTTWSLWRKYPYNAGDVRYACVNGYDSFEQLDKGTSFLEIFPKVHPDLDMEEVGNMVGELRSMPAQEIWRLVDQVMPEDEGSHE